MTRSVTAAVFRGAGTPPMLEELQLADPGPEEVVVRVKATGICHTDIAMARGELWPVYPVVLGHEIAGTVEALGAEVAGLTVGRRVVILDGHCGRCADCESGHPVQCRTFDLAERRRHLADATGAAVFQSMGGFADLLVCPAHSVFPVPVDIPFEVAAVASCAGTTGVGAVLDVAQARVGDSVAVVGCGGVGLSAVMAAVVAGANPILAIDPDPTRRELAVRLGATAALEPDLGTVRAAYPEGFNVVIESAGRPSAMTMATRLIARGGCAVLTGAPGVDVTMEIDALDLVVNQRRILGCLRGDIRPDIGLPRIFDLYMRGRLPLEALITGRIALPDIASAFGAEGLGGLRTVVVPTSVPVDSAPSP